MKKSHYCKGCKKLLMKGNVVDAEVKCHRCKTENKITFVDDSSILTLYLNHSTLVTGTSSN